jgi:hypothetical protein
MEMHEKFFKENEHVKKAGRNLSNRKENVFNVVSIAVNVCGCSFSMRVLIVSLWRKLDLNELRNSTLGSAYASLNKKIVKIFTFFIFLCLSLSYHSFFPLQFFFILTFLLETEVAISVSGSVMKHVKVWKSFRWIFLLIFARIHWTVNLLKCTLTRSSFKEQDDRTLNVSHLFHYALAGAKTLRSY